MELKRLKSLWLKGIQNPMLFGTKIEESKYDYKEVEYETKIYTYSFNFFVICC